MHVEEKKVPRTNVKPLEVNHLSRTHHEHDLSKSFEPTNCKQNQTLQSGEQLLDYTHEYRLTGGMAKPSRKTQFCSRGLNRGPHMLGCASPPS